MSQVGGSLQLNFNASLAGDRPSGSPLIEIAFDLTNSGSLQITGQSLTIDGRSANVGSLEPVTFEILPSLVARDTTAEAVQDGPDFIGNVLENDGGVGLSVVSLDGVAENIGTAITGAFGTLTLTEDGSFTYLADNATGLPEGETAHDIFVYEVTDSGGAQREARLIVTVTGVNDPASIAGDNTGLVVEDDAARQTTTGVLTVTDPGAGEDRFAEIDPAALAGDYGAFAFDPETGAWTYTLDNDLGAVQALPEGVEVSDSLTVSSLDGTASETITVTIRGIGVRTPDHTEIAQLSGSVQDRAGGALDAVSVTFTPDGGADVFDLTNSTGRFDIEAAPGMTGRIQGTREYNANTDGNITALDALNVLRLAVGIAPSWGSATPMDFIAADINRDGQVTALDALEVLRSAVGVQGASQPRWIFIDSDADLSWIDRSNTDIDTGVRVDTLTAGLTEVSMTGVLLGSMQEYA